MLGQRIVLTPTLTAVIVWDGTHRPLDGWGRSKGLLLANEGGYGVIQPERDAKQKDQL